VLPEKHPKPEEFFYRRSQLASVVYEFDPHSGKQTAAWVRILSPDQPDVDFVVSWGTPGRVPLCSNPIEPALEETLHVHYDRVLAKEELSRVEVWRKHTEWGEVCFGRLTHAR